MEGRRETAADVSGCVFSVLLQKVKIKIQNDVIVHQSASLSVNEDVRINFKQSNQCLNALKRQKCAIKKIDRKILMLTPGPLVQKALQISFFDRSFSGQVFGSSSLQVFKSKSQVFKSKSRRNHEQKVFKSKSCHNHEQKVNKVLAPGPLFLSAIVPKVLQNSFFDRSLARVFSSRVFKS